VRKSLGLFPPIAAACACALAAAIPGCDLTTYAQATGFVRPADTLEPRWLEVTFDGGTDQTAAEGIAASTSCTLISFVPGTPPVGIFETPLGYSLTEKIAELTGTSGVSGAPVEVLDVYPSPLASYILVSEDGMREVAWLNGDAGELQAVEYQKIVRFEGTHDLGGAASMGVLNIESIEVTGDRVVQKGGTLTVVDRTADVAGWYVAVLVDDLRGEAWEIVGDSALVSEIIALGDGTLVSVTGTELAPSLTSYAGGLTLSAASYADLTADEATARALVTTALTNLDPVPDPGDDVRFLPIKLTAGAIASVPVELDLFAAASTISEDGYLVFVDNTNATPPWQIVFVKAVPGEPVVLFGGHPLTSLRVKDAAGDSVNGPWVVY